MRLRSRVWKLAVDNDFYIKNDLVVGTKKSINLIGIESPGITASLAIAKYVCNLILKVSVG